MPDREEGLVIEDLAPSPGAVDPGEVADVVAVSLQPADHRVLGVERRVLRSRTAGGEGAVVADLVGPGRIRPGPAVAALVQAPAAVLVVGLPGRVLRLEEEVRLTGVVTDDEEDVAAV